MKRIEKIIQEYKQRLIEKGIKNIPEFVEQIIQADITRGKYTRFLLDCFIEDKFRLEDVQGGLESTIGQSVSLFHKHKAKLPEDMRSVTKYSSPGDLWQAVREYEQVLTGKEEKKSEKEKAYSETEFVYHDEASGFQIVSPLTMYSAQWWGKGTRWCTSAENNNMFEYYAKKNPIFIILMPDGQKLQLWKNNKINHLYHMNANNIQFMDEADRMVNFCYTEDNWQYLKEICLYINDLRFIPKKYITPEICKVAIEHSGYVFFMVPEDCRTLELYQLALEKNPRVLEYIPDELKTLEMCQSAIQKNGIVINFVPEKYLTPELWELAIKSNGYAIRFIPEELKTQGLYQIALKEDGRVMEFIPEKYLTPELCKLAVKKYGYYLKYVPDKYKTQELYQLAVKNDGMALGYVPEKYKKSALYKIAIKQNGYVLKYVPDKYKTPELCKIAVKQNGRALQYVPEEMKTLELCQIAIQSNVMALEFIPFHIKSQLDIPEFISPDYTEQYNEIRSLFQDRKLSLKL